MSDKTPQEKYAAAFKELLKAKKEVANDQSNPFNLKLPTHGGLDEESFISESELDTLSEKIGDATANNQKFARLWNIGSDVVTKAKTLIK